LQNGGGPFRFVGKLAKGLMGCFERMREAITDIDPFETRQLL
jgi:hypothetical protein